MYSKQWHILKDINHNTFDWNWKPPEWDPPYIYAWGNKWIKAEESPSIEYHVPGATQYKYMPDPVEMKLDMFWVDVGNGANSQYTRLKSIFPGLISVQYCNNWIETIAKCAKQSTTTFCWILSSELDYSQFDFDHHPGTGQTRMIHIFGHQWSKWGNTYLVNSTTFEEDTKNYKKISEIKNMHLHEHTRAIVPGCLYNTLHIDFGNTGGNCPANGNVVYTTPWSGNYLTTITSWLTQYHKTITGTHIWVTSSICDYKNFDFTWTPDPYNSDQLHIFSSTFKGITQKFGDTFLINIMGWFDNTRGLQQLTEYQSGVNYIQTGGPERLPHPVIKHSYSSHMAALSLLPGNNFPYIELVATNGILEGCKIEPPAVWNMENFEVLAYGSGGEQIVVPFNISNTVTTQIWDYPVIKQFSTGIKSRPLDIIFISNGESVAGENFDHLTNVLQVTGATNNLIWIKDVSGRVASQHAAANASKTDWYFLVNGKIRVGNNFDWGWQPDRLQAEKHYIFKVHNPVNGLYYGHQAIVANNKNLTLSTQVSGLDFTLNSPHTVVDMDCGVAVYNSDRWTAWRTAFREAIKLRCNSDKESVDRLQAWLSPGNGHNAEWSQRGALDGVTYWKSVNGDIDQLMLSYDWEWIHKYYCSRYGE